MGVIDLPGNFWKIYNPIKNNVYDAVVMAQLSLCKLKLSVVLGVQYTRLMTDE